MKRTGFISRIRSVMVVVALLATSVVGAVAATPSIAQAYSCNCLRTNLLNTRDAFGGKGGRLSFDWTNDSDQTFTDAAVSVTFPEGVDFFFSNLDDGNFVYDEATRTLTGNQFFWNIGPNGWFKSTTVEPWAEESSGIWVDWAPSLSGSSVAINYKATFVDSSGIARTNLNVLNVDVQAPAPDFDYRTETKFTPAGTDYNGTSTLTSKLFNDGPGKGGSTDVGIYFDENLTLTSDVPDGCTDYGVHWGRHNIDCYAEVPESGSPPGLVASWTFTVKAPDAPIPAAVESETYEAQSLLGCSTQNFSGGDEINEDNNESSALLTVPPAPAGNLAVVRNLPAFIDKPGIITNPTAGRSMSSSVDVYNTGNAAVTGPITVVIAPTAGFTPTSISATSEDTTTPAPSCVLATLTCTFSHLGAGQKARIVLSGDLAPTIADGTAFSSSVTVSAEGFEPDTDTDTTTISALAEGFISIGSVSHAKPGDQVDYSVTASNAGPSTMFSPVATLTLPAGMTIVNLPDNCTQSGNTLTCTLGESLDPEADYSFGFTAGLPDEAGDHTITATLSSSTPLAEASTTEADHLVATATTVTDLGVDNGALPYTGSNSGMLALIGGGLALGGLILVSATGMFATRRRND